MPAETIVNAPGRLGKSDLILQDDPRLLPKLKKTLVEMGYGGKAHVDPPAEFEAYHAHVGELGAMADKFYDTMPIELPDDHQEPAIEPETITIDGVDGNKINIHIFRPPHVQGYVPAVLYFHGGAMMYLKTMSKPHVRWVKSLALKGVIGIAVDFRNVHNDGEYCPFPAGLNDCTAAVEYVHAHRASLRASKVVVQGESGGGNLALATALKLNRDGRSEALAGVYAYCPYIGGIAHSRSENEKLVVMLSAIENDGYIQESAGIPPAARYYSPNNLSDPLAWPYFAEDEDLRGLPPHAFSFDELDTLRDEGIAYYRKVLSVGVKATAEMGFGMPHGSRLMFRQAIPEEYAKLLDSVITFTNSL